MHRNVRLCFCFSRLLNMYSANARTLKSLCSMQSNFGKLIYRTIFSTFRSKPILAAKDTHSNLLTNTENIFEVQHHTVKPSSMVNKFRNFPN